MTTTQYAVYPVQSVDSASLSKLVPDGGRSSAPAQASPSLESASPLPTRPQASCRSLTGLEPSNLVHGAGKGP
jgi:hypothetical protein